MTYRLGLTGSIGMGKSTTAAMFAEAGCAIWDADSAVHQLYLPSGAGAQAIAEVWPDVVGPTGVDRGALKALIEADAAVLAQLEEIVHPLVRRSRDDFAETSDAQITVFDIPLLFETGADAEMDSVAVVSTDAVTQRRRVMDRPGMTSDIFDTILARQMPDAEKRRRADHIIPTDTMEGARAAVQAIIDKIKEARHA